MLLKLGFETRILQGDRGKYIWFFNLLKDDVKHLQCTHSIDTFLNNSALPTYWREKISIFDKSKRLRVPNNLSKVLVGIQENKHAIALTVDFFKMVKMPHHLVDYYTKKASEIFNEYRTSRKGRQPNPLEEQKLTGAPVQKRAPKKSIIPFVHCTDCGKYCLGSK